MIAPGELELGGRRLELVLNWNALAAFERLSGKNALKEWTWSLLSATDVLFLLYASANRWTWKGGRQVLADAWDEVSLDWLSSAIDYGNLEPVQEALAKLYGAAFPEAEEGGQPTGGDPPRSPGSISGASAGTTSASPSSSSGT